MRDLSLMSGTAFLLVFSVSSPSSLAMLRTRLDLIRTSRQDWKVGAAQDEERGGNDGSDFHLYSNNRDQEKGFSGKRFKLTNYLIKLFFVVTIINKNSKMLQG